MELAVATLGLAGRTDAPLQQRSALSAWINPVRRRRIDLLPARAYVSRSRGARATGASGTPRLGFV